MQMQALSGEFAVAGCVSHVSDTLRVRSLQLFFCTMKIYCTRVRYVTRAVIEIIFCTNYFCGKQKPEGEGVDHYFRAL